MRFWKNWIVHNASVFGSGLPTESLLSMFITTTGLVLFFHSFSVVPRAIGRTVHAAIDDGLIAADGERKQFEASPERYMIDAFKRADVVLSSSQYHAIRIEVIAAADTPTFLYNGLSDLLAFGLTMRKVYENWVKMTG
jgi:hypothetical protein